MVARDMIEKIMNEMMKGMILAYLLKMAIEDLVGNMRNEVIEQEQRNLLKRIAKQTI